MTRVLVSDTSILVDLERGRLLEAAFRLETDFVVPDLLFEDELRESNGAALIELGLQVQELDGAGVSRALEYREQAPVLSLPDAFALSLAKEHETTLLTGDAALRSLAEEEHVDCHGLLWVLDLMFNGEGVVPTRDLHDGLQMIFAHPRCRLPKREVQQRLRQFAEAIAAEENANREND